MIIKLSKLLEKIKDYPDETQRMVCLSVSGVITFIIVSMSVMSPASPPKELADSTQAENIPSPFSMIKKEFSSSFSTMMSGVSSSSIHTLKLLFDSPPSENSAMPSSFTAAASSYTTIIPERVVATTTEPKVPTEPIKNIQQENIPPKTIAPPAQNIPQKISTTSDASIPTTTATTTQNIITAE